MPAHSNDTVNAEKPVGPLRVLIAEDEPLLQMSLEDILNDLGCRVIASAESVQVALEKIDAENFDLAILDVNLSDGPCGPIVDRLSTLGVPVVFATGSLDAKDYAGPVVGKPYNFREIEQAVTRAVGRRPGG